MTPQVCAATEQPVGELRLTNGALTHRTGGGPVDVVFLGGANQDRLLSDVLSDALAWCIREREYAQIEMTLRFKKGLVTVDGPPTADTVRAHFDQMAAPERKGDGG